MLRAGIGLLLAALAVIALGAWLQGEDEPSPRVALAATETGPRYGPASHGEAVAAAEALVKGGRARLAAAPEEWLHEEVLALALMQRGRLGGHIDDHHDHDHFHDHDDFREAGRLLDGALARVPDPAGPSLTRAALAISLHDLDTAERALARFARGIAPSSKELAEAEALRGDIAFQGGNLAEAEAAYRQAARLDKPDRVGMRLANHALWSGDPDKAAELLENQIVSAPSTPFNYAQSALQRANIAYAQGDLPRAREWIDAANERFSGYWLGDVYAAQQDAAEGDIGGAIAKLSALAEQTGDPEVMDLLAGFLTHAGKHARAAQWAARSEAAWDEKLTKDRASYRLHAAEHHLDFGDPAKALPLAREEVAARPFGEAIEVYASALTATGAPTRALEWLDQAEDAGWRSVSLYMARAEALAALGREREARKATEAALALSPMAQDPMRKLLRFGHY